MTDSKKQKGAAEDRKPEGPEGARPGRGTAPALPRQKGSGPFAFLSRRRWMRLGLGAGGVLLAATGGGLAWFRGCPPDVEGLKVLDDHEHLVLTGLVEVLFPSGGAVKVDVASLELPRAFDEFLAGEPEQNVTDLRRAITLVEAGPLVFEGRMTKFSQLSHQERTAHWERWMTSDRLIQRKVAIAFRSFFHLVFYDTEAVWPYIGYPGPSLKNLGQSP